MPEANPTLPKAVPSEPPHELASLLYALIALRTLVASSVGALWRVPQRRHALRRVPAEPHDEPGWPRRRRVTRARVPALPAADATAASTTAWGSAAAASAATSPMPL